MSTAEKILPPLTPTQASAPMPEPAPTQAPMPEVSQPEAPSIVSRTASFVKRHWMSLTLGVIILAVIILIVIGFSTKESFGDVFYLDQLAMLNTDPTLFKYTGNDRDILGESGRDYYLANQTYANSRAAPQLLEDNDAYVNRSDYLDMPTAWRPLPMKADGNAPNPGSRFVRSIFRVGQSGNVAAQEMGPETSIY